MILPSRTGLSHDDPRQPWFDSVVAANLPAIALFLAAVSCPYLSPQDAESYQKVTAAAVLLVFAAAFLALAGLLQRVKLWAAITTLVFGSLIYLVTLATLLVGMFGDDLPGTR